MRIKILILAKHLEDYLAHLRSSINISIHYSYHFGYENTGRSKDFPRKAIQLMHEGLKHRLRSTGLSSLKQILLEQVWIHFAVCSSLPHLLAHRLTPKAH